MRREPRHVGCARIASGIEPEVRELDRQLRGKRARLDRIERPQIVLAHCRGLPSRSHALAEVRDDGAKVLRDEYGRGVECGTELLSGKEALDRTPRELVLPELVGQPLAAGSAQEDGACKRHEREVSDTGRHRPVPRAGAKFEVTRSGYRPSARFPFTPRHRCCFAPPTAASTAKPAASSSTPGRPSIGPSSRTRMAITRAGDRDSTLPRTKDVTSCERGWVRPLVSRPSTMDS